MKICNRAASVLAAVVALTGPLSAAAQKADAYPSRPIRLIGAAAPGGGNDIVARLIAEKLAMSMGQPVVVENKPGANGIVAVNSLLQSPADGYTLLIIHTAYAQNPAVRPGAYNPADLIGISQVVGVNIALAVSSSLSAHTLPEFVATARAKPGVYSYGVYGVASTAHIYGEIFKSAAGIDVTTVQYKGEMPSHLDLLGGQITASWGSVASLNPFIRDGKMKLLAVTGESRMRLAPEVPTFSEQGYPQLSLSGFIGVLSRAGTPPEIVQKLTDEISRIVQLPEVSAKIVSLGMDPIGTKAPDFNRFLADNIQRWAKVFKENKIAAK